MKPSLAGLSFSLLAAVAHAAPPPAQADPRNVLIPVLTESTALVFQVDGDGNLNQLYLGAKEGAPAAANPKKPKDPGFPAGGGIFVGQPAVRVRHADGNTSTDLKCTAYATSQPEPGVTLVTIDLKDSYYPFTTRLFFKAHTADNVIEQWSEFRHEEEKAVLLQDFASASLTFDSGAYWLTHFNGAWADEMKPSETKLTRGIKLVDSKYGIMGTQYNEPHFLVSLDQPATETSGRVLAGTLAWSGNFALNFEIDDTNHLRALAGMNPYASERILEPKEAFATPPLVYTFSDHGKGEASRNLHRWARKHGVRHGVKPQLVLNNNWEATGFNFDEKKIVDIMKGTKDLGAELFLLDDGWFGNGKHARLADNAGLGDWEPNRDRLPNGLKPLADAAEQTGLKFGIWVEPEMVNVKSDLYEKHPDWILTQPHRPLHFRRNQLALDLSRPEVQEHAFQVVDRTLKSAPSTAYVKWDCNRYLTNPGSSHLGPDKQSHLWIDYIRGLYTVMDRIAKAHPDVTFMVCSGGGGRVDYGSLSYFQQFWPSDNTDALRRISMQWDYSYFFPATAISSHVTHWGKRSLKFAFDVAMSQRLGMDLDPTGLSEEERAITRQANELYITRLRDTVQFGELYRLESPHEGKRASQVYVKDGKAVAFAWQIEDDAESGKRPLKLAGLDPQKTYRVEEVNVKPGTTSKLEANGKELTGEQLMQDGLALPFVKKFDSAVLVLTSK